MARPFRVEYPDAYYHVINRGNGGEELGSFFDASGTAITMRYKQFSREINASKQLSKRVLKIKKQLLNS